MKTTPENDLVLRVRFVSILGGHGCYIEYRIFRALRHNGLYENSFEDVLVSTITVMHAVVCSLRRLLYTW